MAEYAIEMLNITKRFPGIVANDNITLQLKKGEIHALLGENGAGKSTLMSVLFGLYQPEEGEIRKDGKKVEIKDPNDANELGIGMVHQHFKLVECFSVLDNIILGVETTKGGFLKKKEAKKKVMELSEKYGLAVDPDALIEDITVGMQQRTEILKMLYRDNDILIFDEPTAVLTPQEIQELMSIMKNLAAEGKSILFITHKLAEIMQVSDRCTVLRKGKYIGTVETKDTTPEKLSTMMVGRDVSFVVEKEAAKPGDVVLDVRDMTVASKHHKNNAVNNVSLQVRRGEIVCIAGIDGNGQTEFVYGLTGLEPLTGGTITMNGADITHAPIRKRLTSGMSHIPEDRHKHGLVLDYTLEDNIILQRYFEPEFTNKAGFLKRKPIREYADRLIGQYDVRSGQGAVTTARSMSGGNQQKAIVAREIDKNPELLVAVQPTRGLDVGAIEYIHKQLVAQRDAGKGVLLVSLELDEVMNVSDRILVMYEGEIVGEFDPKKVTVEELGLYMAGSKKHTPGAETDAAGKAEDAAGTEADAADTGKEAGGR
ncbi:MAG TPA: ABC transporter ATP-binding protein [Candidatus Mediterraneibacter merdavium]|nr:ABC transporter ATP-binding protein [Candidatus Mediterraneibacter merdavium]